MIKMNKSKVTIVLVLLASILPFLGLATGSHEFSGFDDRVNIIDNSNIHELSWENVKWMFTGAKLGVYEPISWFIKGSIIEVSGLSPRAFHLTSLALHLGNVVMLYFLAVGILSVLLRDVPVSRISLVSAFMALIYGIHPLRAEVVAWGSGQSYAVGAFFCLSALVCYLQYRNRVDKHLSAYPWLALSALMYVCALFGKSAMVLLPVWLLLIDWYIYQRRDLQRILLEKVPFFLIMIATVVIIVLVNERAMGDNHQILSWPEKFGRAVVGVFIYPIQTLWPPNLTPVYTVPRWGLNIWDKVPLLATIALATIGFYAIRAHKINPWPFAVLFAYGVFLLPVLGFVQHGNPILVADRYSYVSTIPLYLVVAACYLKLELNEAVKTHIKTGLTVCILLLTWMTVKQVGYWQNDKILWKRALQIQPYNAFAGNNLGFRYYKEKDYAAARKYLETAYSSAPHNEFPLLNLGVTYYQMERCDLAIEHYLEAAKTHHADSDGLFNNLGNCYVKLGKYEESIPHFRRALEINPQHPKAGKSLENVLLHLGRQP